MFQYIYDEAELPRIMLTADDMEAIGIECRCRKRYSKVAFDNAGVQPDTSMVVSPKTMETAPLYDLERLYSDDMIISVDRPKLMDIYQVLFSLVSANKIPSLDFIVMKVDNNLGDMWYLDKHDLEDEDDRLVDLATCFSKDYRIPAFVVMPRNSNIDDALNGDGSYWNRYRHTDIERLLQHYYQPVMTMEVDPDFNLSDEALNSPVLDGIRLDSDGLVVAKLLRYVESIFGDEWYKKLEYHFDFKDYHDIRKTLFDFLVNHIRLDATLFIMHEIFEKKDLDLLIICVISWMDFYL